MSLCVWSLRARPGLGPPKAAHAARTPPARTGPNRGWGGGTRARPGPSPPLPGATATLPPSARWGWGDTYLTRMATPTSSQLA